MTTGSWVEGERPWWGAWPAHVERSLSYPSVPAWWLLEQSVARFPDRVAVRQFDSATGSESSSLTYRELGAFAHRVAAGLRRAKVGPGDRVAFSLPNSAELIACYYGTWLCGGVGVPCNPAHRDAETAYILKDAAPRLHLSGCADVHRLATVDDTVSSPACDPDDDIALLLYTGGTTGEPKGAMLTHRNIVANTMQFASWYDFEPGAEVCMATIPMCHSGGMAGVMNVPLYSGATLLVFPRFRAASTVQVASAHRATRFFGVPTMYIAILNDPDCRNADLNSLKACRTNAAALPPAVKADFDALVGHEVLIEGYGLTETSPLTHANPIHSAKAGSIGIPLPDTDARVVDPVTGAELTAGSEGELCVRGPQVMRGYWRKPRQTSDVLNEGWLRTGDIARLAADGYFTIVDRKKDVIISAGFKVWPSEVEEVLYQHPDVQLVAVVGVPDDYRGEAVKAFVVRRDGAKVSVDDLQQHCRQHLAGYKIPRSIEFRFELPLSAAGKVLRRVLREGSPEVG